MLSSLQHTHVHGVKAASGTPSHIQNYCARSGVDVLIQPSEFSLIFLPLPFLLLTFSGLVEFFSVSFFALRGIMVRFSWYVLLALAVLFSIPLPLALR